MLSISRHAIKVGSGDAVYKHFAAARRLVVQLEIDFSASRPPR
jgi:hypothetical protein